ncbi:4Fe-4S binding protein [Lachnoclostridium sp. Marseille-P6806]|uniref:4Fe-4S binding protein n=1 Tax=Lachnoclostridium sp. Marseille-P6806 TaxID=2364793 RepID=UPI0010317E2E|nr:4Fe-4S binding protein [Lachnoclostridium sp. Marseille-P6806]
MLPYFGEAIRNLFKKPATERFPGSAAPKAAECYRGRLSYDPTKCVNCGMCIRVCAPQCMTRTIREIDGETQEITFTFDMTSCTFCGMCADFCSQHSIVMTDDYMMVSSDPKDFLVTGSFQKKKPAAPKFTPEQLAAMKAAAEAKKKAAAEKQEEKV